MGHALPHFGHLNLRHLPQVVQPEFISLRSVISVTIPEVTRDQLQRTHLITKFFGTPDVLASGLYSFSVIVL